MKRFVCLLLTSAMLFCCACTKTNDGPDATVITKPSGQSTTTTTATTTTTSTTTTTTDITIDPTTPPSDENTIGNAIADLALSLVGTPFEAGGDGPHSFDNPGFVKYCYKQNGFTVPRKAALMKEYGIEITPDSIRRGDILVFCNEIGEEAGYVGIYIGDNQFVACPNPETPTKIQKLNVSYWSERFLTARRYTE